MHAALLLQVTLFANGRVGVHEASFLEDLDNGCDIFALERLDGLAHLVCVEHAHLPQCRLERAHAGTEADGRLHDAGEEHEACEVILQLLDLRPVACLERLVLLDVAERIEVREAGNGAVRAA